MRADSLNMFVASGRQTADNHVYYPAPTVSGLNHSPPQRRKQQGLSQDKVDLLQLFNLCLTNLARMQSLVYLDPRMRQE